MPKTPKRVGTHSSPADGKAASRPARIVPATPHSVKSETPVIADPPKRGRRPGRPKSRRQSHGSAWHWRQTDRWYYTIPGKKRAPLLDEDGARVRGKDNKE
jgi:hypothetical protein